MNHRHKTWLGAVVAAAIVAAAVLYAIDRSAQVRAAQPQANVATPAGPNAVAATLATQAPYTDEGLRSRKAQLTLWQKRLARAEQTLSTYEASTRYPHESRPIEEHPDQLHPFDAVAEDKLLRTPGGEVAPGVHVRTTQERIFASGEESVQFTITAVDDAGKTLPLLITQAVAFDVPDPRRAMGRPQVTLDFADAGSNGDALRGDGTYTAQLRPAKQGFGDYAGIIRVQVYLNQSGQLGNVYFDVIYNPDVPAEWAGVREALQDGSLDFYLKAKVNKPGRYVLSARVDDAAGQPFALLSFNNEVAAGEQEFKLRLFGKLLRDGKPAFPLTLRDVQGFLLLPDHFPDRAMMPRLPGTVHTSERYALTSFSDTEWHSEERDRYLTELGKDVNEASNQIKKLKN